jgi:hypothetical protein
MPALELVEPTDAATVAPTAAEMQDMPALELVEPTDAATVAPTAREPEPMGAATNGHRKAAEAEFASVDTPPAAPAADPAAPSTAAIKPSLGRSGRRIRHARVTMIGTTRRPPT